MFRWNPNGTALFIPFETRWRFVPKHLRWCTSICSDRDEIKLLYLFYPYNIGYYLQYLTNTISSFVATVGNKVRDEFSVSFLIFKNNWQVQTRIWLKYNLSMLKILGFFYHQRCARVYNIFSTFLFFQIDCYQIF